MEEKNLSNGKAVNCFAIHNGICSVLKTTNCETCKFFKTKKQLIDEKNKCATRLKDIDFNNKYTINI